MRKLTAPLIGAALTAAAFWALPAHAKTVKIVNSTPYALVGIQVKKPDTVEWQPDVLGKTTLGVGRAHAVDVDVTAGCVYDILVTLDDGHRVERRVDLCQVESYTVRDDE